MEIIVKAPVFVEGEIKLLEKYLKKKPRRETLIRNIKKFVDDNFDHPENFFDYCQNVLALREIYGFDRVRIGDFDIRDIDKLIMGKAFSLGMAIYFQRWCDFVLGEEEKQFNAIKKFKEAVWQSSATSVAPLALPSPQ
jgi:hypothetical protein